MDKRNKIVIKDYSKDHQKEFWYYFWWLARPYELTQQRTITYAIWREKLFGKS